MIILQAFGFAFFSLLLLGLPSELKAQTEEPTKVVECTYIYWDGVPNEEFFFRIGDEYYPMNFRRGARAKMLSVARMEKFQLFKKSKQAVDMPDVDDVGYEFLAETLVPEHMNQVLFLVIAPDEGLEVEEQKYRVFALDDSVEVFGRKTFRFVNLTQQVISVDFAEETPDIPPNDDIVIPTKVDKSGGFVPCIIRDPEGKIVFGTRLFCQPNSREIVFIRPSIRKNIDTLRVKFFSQFVKISITGDQ
ncbi:MAG: hypothetical protein ACPIA7_01840 [Akkermansiaceae bacterium]